MDLFRIYGYFAAASATYTSIVRIHLLRSRFWLALVLLFVALWFIVRGDLFYIILCYFVLVFSVLLALRLPRLGKRELILVRFVRLFDLRLFGFVCFLLLLVSEKGCGLRLWYSLDYYLILPFLTSKATKKIFLHRYDK